MNHVCIIAEAGVNHNGSIETALKMVDYAKEIGVDYIKFQTFVPDKLVSKYAEKADYQKKPFKNESQLEMLKNLSLTKDEFCALKEYCSKIKLGFISTPFDLDSIEFLNTLNMDFWKLPSGEITNLPYLEAIAKTGRKIIMSTGMCDINEIEDAIKVLKKNGIKDITLLHCNTQYPTPYEDVNLKAMLEMKKIFKTEIGYSDHTNGIEVPIAAVAMGATVIEKHFTLDKEMEGPDHKASLNTIELKEMVTCIRNIEKALGTNIKNVTNSEMKNKIVVRKSIVASKCIRTGEILNEENITVKRPGNGINPMKWYDVIGTCAIRDFEEDEQIEI